MIRAPALIGLCLLAGPLAALAEDTRSAPEPGRVTGGKISSHPGWFKESFLDIAEDVDDAAAHDKHVILFLEMNGCPYCYKMIEENFKGSDYSDFIQQRFDVIALNIRGDREVALDADTTLTEKQLAAQLGVRYTPTILFLNQANEPVARINGYRNVADFKQVLDYVDAKAYESRSLAQYLDDQKAKARGGYAFRDDPKIREAVAVGDLSSIAGPLVMLFEDSACIACAALHEGHLASAEGKAALAPFTVVRVDALSDVPFTGLDGTQTTGKQLAAELGIEYRPSLVLYDGPAGGEREIARIEGMLYRHHFVGVLEYVGEGHYKDFPRSPFDYINDKTARLTAEGKDVAIADE
jgi:thioredoxin-related protein